MAITTVAPNSAKLDFAKGIHDAGDVYKIALYTESATLGKATRVYSAVNEVPDSGTYVAGGQILTGYSAGLDGDAAIIDWNDPVWLSATIAAAGALIYNSSKSNKAVAILDFGGVIASTNGTFLVTLPPATAKEATVRFSS